MEEEREREKTRPLFPMPGENPCAASSCWEPPCQAALSSLGEGGTSVATPSGHAVLAEEVEGQACGLSASVWRTAFVRVSSERKASLSSWGPRTHRKRDALPWLPDSFISASAFLIY